ncbi:MAG: DPP IV N-terminal domain-containing protein [Bacteroidota bacterium]
MRSFSLLTLVVLITLAGTETTQAQQANFELAERFTTQNMQKMVGSTNVFPRWIEDSDRFWYQYETGEGKNWYYVDPARGQKRLLFDQEEMAGQLSEHFSRPFNAKDLDLKGFEYDTDRELFTFHVDSIEFTYNINGNRLVKGDSLESEPRENWATYSPDSTWIAFAKNHNLFIMRSNDPDSTEYQLTEDGERWFSYQANDGDTTSTKRLRSRANWFEDNMKLWVKRQDKRKVDDLWVINSLKKRPELETYKYPMPGEEDIFVDEIKVFDPSTREHVVLQTDKWEDQSLGGAYFNQGGIFETQKSDYLYILRRNRMWNEIDVLKANTSTGEVEILFSETSKPYFNTRFAQLAVIEEGKEFIWWSERTGWGQLYRYDAEGNLKNTITKGPWVAGSIAKIDTAASTIYFSGYGREEGQHPYYQNLYSVRFDGSNFRHLSTEDANHAINASEEGNFFVDNMSRVDMPTKSVVRDATGKIIIQLEEVDVTTMQEAGYQFPETFHVKAADGATDLYGVMWKPFDFDPEKSYPIISYVYPGPQVESFPIGFTVSGSRGRPQTLAQLGFIVIAQGQRGGSPIRSKYYHNYGYGDMRDYALADNKYTIEQLAAKHSFIDIDRVGIFGHSGGGFMSTAALLSYPDFYDVAVSSAGNHDNNVYNIWWSEVHNGVKEKRKKVKKMNADSVEVEEEEITFDAPIETNAALAKNLKGHLLLVHGDMDNNVHPANTIRLADALIKAGKRFDMMMLPGKRHGFGSYTPYFERMMWYYFSEHLLDDNRSNEVDFNLPEDD